MTTRYLPIIGLWALLDSEGRTLAIYARGVVPAWKEA